MSFSKRRLNRPDHLSSLEGKDAETILQRAFMYLAMRHWEAIEEVGIVDEWLYGPGPAIAMDQLDDMQRAERKRQAAHA